MEKDINSNKNENWTFNFFFAIILTLTTLGLYLIVYILFQTIFIMYGHSDSIETNIYNIKLTLLILIPTIFFQLLFLSWKGKFAEKFELEINNKKEDNNLNKIIEKI